MNNKRKMKKKKTKKQVIMRASPTALMCIKLWMFRKKLIKAYATLSFLLVLETSSEL
jgi:hypothetical protein